VEDYRAPTPADPGQLVINLVPLGVATGYPLQEYRLTEFPVSGGSLRLWTLEDGAWQPWDQVPDFDSSDQDAHAYGLDPTQGIVRFGDGQRGRVPLPGVPILAAYEVTEAAAGNLPAAAVWQLAGADDSLNRALLGAEFPAAMNGLRPAANPLSVSGGADEEDVSHAAGRAAAGLYAHERLVELSDELGSDSLDQVRPDRTLALQAPQRAATLLDYDRLALDVPGTRVARARSWAGMDPTHPCLQAPGTVSVVILPELPVGRPAPTPGLLQTVQRYLGRRKLLGTRLVVCGPSYREVTVEASIQGVPGSDAGQLQARVAQTLNAFLDPLTGGPDGLGWPFGRDVYRSEILQVIGAVPGVDHVIRLTLKTDQGEPQCDNLCVGPMGLVTAGPHIILVE
jgi:hypothetical protein